MNEEALRFEKALQQVNRCLGSELMQKMSAPVTFPQILMLHFIDEEGLGNLKQLADKLEVKPSAVTVMIDRLEKSGYVERSNDPHDRRAIRAAITPLGQEVLEQVTQDRMAIVGHYLSRLEPQEVVIVTELLEKMTRGRDVDAFGCGAAEIANETEKGGSF